MNCAKNQYDNLCNDGTAISLEDANVSEMQF